jgi:tetraspanin-18
MNCIRLLFSIYNFIFLIVGAIILGLGIWIVADPNFAEHLQKLVDEAGTDEVNDTVISVVKGSGYVLIAFDAIVFFLSFVGYCGAVKESRCLLGVYAFVLVVLLILEIVAVILILAVYGPKIEDETQTFLVKQMRTKYQFVNYPNVMQDVTGFTKVLDGIMVKFECCGINNASDFAEVRPQIPPNPVGTKVPLTCCKCQDVNACRRLPDFPSSEDLNGIRLQECRVNPTSTDSNIYNGSCYQKLKDKLLGGGRKTGGIIGLVIVGLLQLTGIIFGIYTYKKAGRNY